ncbi:hypothetical protein CONCODRAFT_5497 [Conidiobolus coronatus NRRL 28638]|uniref:RZ-type domain-containing protein n=1 Tax=Conidiobolus coronatus (strain ATCC 28846 / CBS 209.66 / NRRL 28638) TaxID=796925 RepID=A0A137P9V1_CONC2|nr:hypothetical protein CONCODRAFT_5497 [Conidiobolus coronatus NRRL 28638]|eukprot:KXN71786.1 hypothetical protein CONCODRAFT_5497 [Conidiobolus coronatus NRRL 28638]
MSYNKIIKEEYRADNDEDSFIISPVTQAELNSIAMALANDLDGPVHCYTCPNGHPYVIDACGVPMTINECFICKEKIGGDYYIRQNGLLLVKGNRFDHKMNQLIGKYKCKKF